MNITRVRLLKLSVMYCTNSFTPDDLNEHIMEGDGEELKMIGLPCSGKADLLYMVKAVEKGADGVVVMTCPKSECRYQEGSRRASMRAEGVNGILEETGLSKDRVRVISVDERGLEGAAQSIDAFKKELKEIIRLW